MIRQRKEIKELFDTGEILKLSKIKENNLRRLCHLDLIPYIKLGGRIYFDLAGLLEIRSIVKLGLTPKQIKECQQYFDDFRMSKSLADKSLIVLDKSVIMIESLSDLTILNTKAKGQKIIGEILLPDLYTELRHQANILKIANYSEKFKLA